MKKRKKISGIIRIILLIIITITVLYPVFLIIQTSLKTEKDFIINPIGFSGKYHFNNFIDVFSAARMPISYLNSIILTACSLFGQIFLGSLAAYALTKMNFKKSGIIMNGFLLPMMVFSINIVVLPVYIIFQRLHLTNSLIGAIIIYIATGLPMAIFILAKFLIAIPIEISESAFVDGATHFQNYSKIILPLMKVPIITIIVINGLRIWNDFFVPIIFFTKRKIPTVTLGLYMFSDNYYTDWTKICADIVLMALPLVIVYAFLQKYVIEGVVAGSIKG